MPEMDGMLMASGPRRGAAAPEDHAAPEDLVDEVTRLRARVRELERELARDPDRARTGDPGGALIDGTVRPGRAAGGPIYAHELLHKLVSHSPVILWSVDAGGRIELSEGKGLERQGFRPGELAGRSIFEVYAEHPDFLRNVRRALAGEAFSARNEFGGASYERWFEPVIGADGEVSGAIGVSVDITEQERSALALRENNQLLRTALDSIPDGVQVLDRDLKLVAWNDRLWEVLELDGEAVLAAADPGKAFRYALASRGEYGEGELETLVASREAIARTPVPVHYERQLVSGKWIECRGTPVPGGGYLAIYRDIHESKRLEHELERLATYDELTGLRNRRSLLACLQSELERQQRYACGVSVLVIDVDHFKSVNDCHGHAAGDTVLQRVSQGMLAVMRDVDVLGRTGGEEFAAVLPQTDPAGALRVAERLRAAVAALDLDLGEAVLRVTVSVGAASAWPDASVKDLLARADRALYAAKHGGRNRVMAHSD
jgi:diguanylate cyclase (GGDEF)-like protein